MKYVLFLLKFSNIFYQIRFSINFFYNYFPYYCGYKYISDKLKVVKKRVMYS